MDMTKLGKELRKIRLDLGITLFDMASAISISSGMLSSIETGRKPAPADFIQKLAQIYHPVALRKAEFDRLADETKNEVKVRLDSANPQANELALAFARKFDTLTDSQIRQMMAVFERKK